MDKAAHTSWYAPLCCLDFIRDVRFPCQIGCKPEAEGTHTAAKLNEAQTFRRRIRMEPYCNPGKRVEIEVDGRRYLRHAIQTHFVGVGEDYVELFRRYVRPVYQPGDLVAVSEKVAALCQGRVVRRADIRVTPLAGLLARCVHQTEAGPGMGLPVKMQFALDECGTLRVLWAAFRAAMDKLRGVHGTFYRLLGPEVRGLDGFYGKDNPAYADLGIRIPEAPDRLCEEVYAATGVRSFIVDANGLGVELLGKAAAVTETDETLTALVQDNPAGQERQLTPFVLIRRC